jgi:hypothetical protein
MSKNRAAVADGTPALASAQVLYVMHINLMIYITNTISITLSSYVPSDDDVLNWKFLNFRAIHASLHSVMFFC